MIGIRDTCRPTLLALLLLGACGSSDLLGPDAAQGIEGIALRGPMCPVQSLEDPCPDEPYQAVIRVLDEGGETVTRIETGVDGRFRVGLRPGVYTLDPVSGDPFPVATPQDVLVLQGSYTEVEILFDTGIR